MKKTLIALMALAGCASALELTTSDLTGYAVANDGWTSVNDWTIAGLTSTLQQNGSVLLSGDIAKLVPGSDDKNRTVTTVAITLDLSKLDLPDATTDAEGNPAVGRANFVTLHGTGTNAIGMALSSEGKVSTIWGTNLSYFTVNSVLATTGTTTLTFSCTTDGTSLYVGSVMDTHSGLKGDLGNITQMTLSAEAVAAMQSISVYSGVGNLRDSDLASSAAAINAQLPVELIPEPTTATLSLLALCGLAARRRRK